ncbi:MAG: homoserine O-acetyltransferase [Deltaproteobacteria bacterium]|nr:homoserine O-acetyltransferase [Deltaproteobacteria bacterium]
MSRPDPGASSVALCAAPQRGGVGVVETRVLELPDGLELESGARLAPITVAYETYGRLAPDRRNAVLVCHALSGDAHAAGLHTPDDRCAGWFDDFIGPGRAFDTDRWFVICSNVLGGCKGTTGPSSIDPRTGLPYGLSFPVVTLRDMVAVQRRLVAHLGIDRLLAVAGGSMGGMQALRWAVDHPDAVASCLAIATAPRQSPQAIAFHEIGRQAIQADPAWRNGAYHAGPAPDAGLAVARMVGHITYLSEAAMQAKFGRRLRGKEEFGYDLGNDFEVESYLRHQGDAFTRRFDANSYLYITKAIDYFDLGRGERSLAAALARARASFLLMSFSSDWLYPTAQTRELLRALLLNGQDASFCEIDSAAGHDAFLLEHERMAPVLRGFLERVHGRWTGGGDGGEGGVLAQGRKGPEGEGSA